MEKDRLDKQLEFILAIDKEKNIFRQTYGRPIHQYLLEKRVQHAAELLHRSPLSIVDIAAAVGYNSASQFGVAFKRRYQLTPSQYRRQARKS